MDNEPWFSLTAGMIGKRPTLRLFKSLFGFSPQVFSVVWSRCAAKASEEGLKQIHILWLFYHIKTYPNLDVATLTIGRHDSTIVKWRRIAISVLIDSLDFVRGYLFL